MSNTIDHDTGKVATVPAVGRATVDRINRQLEICHEKESQAGLANQAIAVAVVKSWAKAGTMFEREKAKLDAKNEKAQDHNRKAKKHNDYHEKNNTGKKPKKLMPITRWEELFSDENVTKSEGEFVTKTSEKTRFNCSKMQAERYRKTAQYPNLAAATVKASGKYNLTLTYRALSDATPEDEEQAMLSMMSEKKRLEHEIKKNTPALPPNKYRVIYADPPWYYNDTMGGQGATAHYPSLTIDELCALPVKDLAQDDAVLFMWTTSPILAECMPIIEAWGFTYKSSIIWDKDAPNWGNYVSVRHELLLICVRGSCQKDSSTLLGSVVKEKRGRHSEKPETFRNMIDQMYTEGNRIELFRRGEAPHGWDTWGNDERFSEDRIGQAAEL